MIKNSLPHSVKKMKHLKKQKNEESKVNDAELEKLRSKIVRLKAKNKKLKNKARTESLTFKND